MTEKENIMRCVRFERPERIPMWFGLNSACWHHYDQEMLKDLMEEHKLLFPNYKRPAGKVDPVYSPNAVAGKPYTDPWGCVWETADNGITGSVHGNPLASWDNFGQYTPPDPGKTDGTHPVDWREIETRVKKTRAEDGIVLGGLPHGHTFLRLQDIRGYENLLIDLVEEEPRALRLIEMVSDFNYGFVTKWLSLKPDIFSYPEDLGMQIGPMISPDLFRKFIKPVYKRLMKPALASDCAVMMHSDGDIRTLADDLVDAGVQILNLQDLVNGIDWIASKYKGKICVQLDIDRQKVIPFGSPAEIDALIREEVEKLGSREGGLMMIHGVYPGVPPANIKAVMDAMEKYMGYYA
jgi:hypothetical protein